MRHLSDDVLDGALRMAATRLRDQEIARADTDEAWATLDEVRAGTSDSIDIVDGADHPHDRTADRWRLIAACGLLLIGSVVALSLIDRNEADAPAVTIEITTPPPAPSTPTPPTTSAKSVPLESFGDGAWWPLGSTVASCPMCSGIVLDDGRVAIIGGTSATQGVVVQLFDPATAEFSVGARLPNEAWRWIVELDDGRILLSGWNGQIAIADLDDGSSDVIRSSGEPLAPIQLADGRVLLFGSSASELDLVTKQITRLAERGGSRPTVDAPTALVELGNGDVLVADNTLSKIFDAETETFRWLANQAPPISWVRRLDDDRYLVARPRPPGELASLADALIYDHTTGTLTDVAGLELPLVGDSGVSAALLGEGRLFVIRQPAQPGGPNPGAAVYDLDTGVVQEVDAPTGRRTWAQPIALPDGRILIVGNYGCNVGCEVNPDADTAELFAVGDPSLPDN